MNEAADSSRSPSNRPLTIVVLGASGDLAHRKIYPALFALHSQDLLPKDVHIAGFARSEYDNEAFRTGLRENLTCRYTPDASECARRMETFLERCYYVQGQYASSQDLLELYRVMRDHEAGEPADRLFYMAVPPFVFGDVARAIGDAGLVRCGENEEGHGWSRVVIEKPFGRDRGSSDELVEQMGQIFTEAQTYRIDHYLGKEVIQDLQVLRFANRIFEPLWRREHIENVWISFREDIGVEGRGDYFDRYGILRDVVQNHLLQIAALVAMERPRSLSAHAVRDAKVELLRAVRPLTRDEVAVGQYARTQRDGNQKPAYREEPGVDDHSNMATLAASVLHIDTPRWRDVPFLLTAGKAMDTRRTEIRVRFKPVDHDLFGEADATPEANEMVICVQPDESIRLSFLNKTPGQPRGLAPSTLDMHYAQRFDRVLPDAYESLLLDVIRGDKSLFLRADELEVSWDIFTGVLHQLENNGDEPEPYEWGARSTDGMRELARRHGVDLGEDHGEETP